MTGPLRGRRCPRCTSPTIEDWDFNYRQMVLFCIWCGWRSDEPMGEGRSGKEQGEAPIPPNVAEAS